MPHLWPEEDKGKNSHGLTQVMSWVKPLGLGSGWIPVCVSQTRRFTMITNVIYLFIYFTSVFQIVRQLFITCLRRNANTSARDLWCPLKNCWNCFSYIAVRQRCKGSRFFHSIIHFLFVLTRCSQRMGHSISWVRIPLPKNTGTIFISVGNYFMMAYQWEWLKKVLWCLLPVIFIIIDFWWLTHQTVVWGCHEALVRLKEDSLFNKIRFLLCSYTIDPFETFQI